MAPEQRRGASVPRNSSYPASVQPGIPKLVPLPSGWSRARYGDLLYEVQRPVKLNDNQEYQLVTAKRSRGGIIARQRLRGEQIKTPTQFFIRTGDFLISRRQIVHGACGVVPPELDGAIASNEYGVLHAHKALDLDYFRHFTHSVYFQQTCFHSSVGVHVEKMIFRRNRSWGIRQQ
jgi:type I restriction enzyme, S subunit